MASEKWHFVVSLLQRAYSFELVCLGFLFELHYHYNDKGFVKDVKPSTTSVKNKLILIEDTIVHFAPHNVYNVT